MSSTTPTGCDSTDHTVAVLGAGAEMGPLPSLLRWGARVAAVDLARPEIWERLLPTRRGLRRLAASCPVAPGRRRARRTARASTCVARRARGRAWLRGSRARW